MTANIDLSFVAFVAGLLILGIAALAWGVDSRSALSDDHNR